MGLASIAAFYNLHQRIAKPDKKTSRITLHGWSEVNRKRGKFPKKKNIGKVSSLLHCHKIVINSSSMNSLTKAEKIFQPPGFECAGESSQQDVGGWLLNSWKKENDQGLNPANFMSSLGRSNKNISVGIWLIFYFFIFLFSKITIESNFFSN